MNTDIVFNNIDSSHTDKLKKTKLVYIGAKGKGKYFRVRVNNI